tara:strand:+ start:133 stop:477 length:345 start_codon:yes stop_codon:yes gene_type:complete
MNDTTILAVKLESHIKAQIKSNDGIERALISLAEQMTAFMKFQTRAEERHANQNEFKEETKKQISEIKIELKSIREYELKPLELVVQKNTLISKGVVGFSCLVIGAGVTFFIGR